MASQLMESLRLDCKKIKAVCVWSGGEYASSMHLYVNGYCKPFVYWWLFSASADTPRTTLNTAVSLSCITVRRKGQCSISVTVKTGLTLRWSAPTWSVLISRLSQRHSYNVSLLDCRSLLRACVTKADRLLLRSLQDLSPREYGKASERHSG